MDYSATIKNYVVDQFHWHGNTFIINYLAEKSRIKEYVSYGAILMGKTNTHECICIHVKVLKQSACGTCGRKC